MKLKELRKIKNISQDQAANALGISLRAYQNYEYEQREPNIEMINKIADFYGVTTDYLLGRDISEPEPLNNLEQQFNMTLLEKKILEGYLALPKDMRDDLMKVLKKSVHEVINEDDK